MPKPTDLCMTSPCKCVGIDPCGSYRVGENPRSTWDLSNGMGPRRLARFVADARRELLPDLAESIAILVDELGTAWRER